VSTVDDERFFVQGFKQLQAGHLGHFHVEENKVHVVFAQKVVRFDRRSKFAEHFKVGRVVDVFADQFAGDGVVVYGDAAHAGVRFWLQNNNNAITVPTAATAAGSPVVN
jgi:hypothetical protein